MAALVSSCCRFQKRLSHRGPPSNRKKRPIDFFFSLLLLLLLLFEGRRNKKTGEMGNLKKNVKKKEFFFLAGTRFSTVRVDAALMMTTSSATLATEFVRPHPRPNTGLHFSRFRCAFYWILKNIYIFYRVFHSGEKRASEEFLCHRVDISSTAVGVSVFIEKGSRVGGVPTFFCAVLLFSREDRARAPLIIAARPLH